MSRPWTREEDGAVGLILGYWIGVRDADPRALALMRRHYSWHEYRDHRPRRKFVGPGEYMALMTEACDALLVWRKFIDHSGQQGINCAVFRNESAVLSSVLIREACELAWRRWPGERLYTYVNPRRIRSTNPGYCFKRAGWSICGVTKCNQLVVLELVP